jgi:Sulfate permease family
LKDDLFAGVTLAAYAIPAALAYAALTGLPPQVGVYGYLLGGLGYALFGSSEPGNRANFRNFALWSGFRFADAAAWS